MGHLSHARCRIITLRKVPDNLADSGADKPPTETFVDFFWTEEAGKEGMSPRKAWPAIFHVKEAEVGRHAEMGTGPRLEKE